MASPVLVPYQSFIQPVRGATTPVYLQVAHQLINAIQRGYLMDGHKLPGSRQLASILGLHRNTVVASYAELEAQGWIAIYPSRGTFVTNAKLEKPKRLPGIGRPARVGYPSQAGFYVKKWTVLDNPFDHAPARLTLDD